MKKVICLITILSLVFGAVCPVFAVTETQVSGFINPNGGNAIGAFSAISSIISYLANLSSQLDTFFKLDSSNNQPSTTYKFQDLYLSLAHIEDWLIPVGARTTEPTLFETVLAIFNESYSYLPYLPTISSSIVNWATTNNSNLATVVNKLATSSYPVYYQNQGQYIQEEYGSTGFESHTWSIANVPILGGIWLATRSTASSLGYGFSRLLTGFDSTLTTWEHSNLTQTSFTPTSAINGLYRYLAYIQSDTAHLDNKLVSTLPSSFSITLLNGNRTYNVSSLSDMLNQWNSALFRYSHSLSGTSATQLGSFTFYNPLTLTSSSEYYYSTDDMIRRIIQRVQYPVSRLAFVLANDEEVAARNAARDDQNSVINNFVASTGQATATPSDYAGVSNASASFKQNFNTGVASSGIWDTFSNTHYTWFTQDTANALDTISASTRGSYDTPLLDNYYHEILGYFDNNRRSEDTAYDYVGNYIKHFNAERVESESDER